MKLNMLSGQAHLTYCTNVHQGETWADTFDALRRHLPAVKRLACPDAPMGVGLRLSAIAAEALEDPSHLAPFCDFLGREGLYVFTINGFPYGPFHGQPVKQQVYAPDWRTPERLAYTNRLATLLASLLPDDQPDLAGSLSTVPGAFIAAAACPGARQDIAGSLLRHAAHLAALEDRTGRCIRLALEPEPMCLLQTTAEAVAFFEAELFSAAAVQRFCALSGRAAPVAESLLRRHLAVCLDVCHAAVEFEAPKDSLALLGRAGIAVAKLQLSSALVVTGMDRGAAALLRRFDDGVYLHQVVERGPAGIVQFLDLPDALAARPGDAGSEREWRVHCHLPVFHDQVLGRFRTTQPSLLQMLELQRNEGISPHLEVETYTWDVLPPELRGGGLDAGIARELDWVRRRLLPGTSGNRPAHREPELALS